MYGGPDDAGRVLAFQALRRGTVRLLGRSDDWVVSAVGFFGFSRTAGGDGGGAGGPDVFPAGRSLGPGLPLHGASGVQERRHTPTGRAVMMSLSDAGAGRKGGMMAE